MLRSDTSTVLLDRNCELQLLGSCSGHRSERHVFKFRTYLTVSPHPTVEVGYGAHLYKFMHVNVFRLASPVSSSKYLRSLVLTLV